MSDTLEKILALLQTPSPEPDPEPEPELEAEPVVEDAPATDYAAKLAEAQGLAEVAQRKADEADALIALVSAGVPAEQARKLIKVVAGSDDKEAEAKEWAESLRPKAGATKPRSITQAQPSVETDPMVALKQKLSLIFNS